MKSFKKLLALTLIFSFCATMLFPNTVYAQTNIQANVQYSKDIYALELEETINIEGTNYTFSYLYENDNRIIYVPNDINSNIDKIYYDEESNIGYLNGQPCFKKITSSDSKDPSIIPFGGWETVGTDSVYISWGAATTAEGIAAMISAALGLIGTAGVIAAMGLAPLISLVGNAGGATIYIEEQTLHMAFEPPRRRYLWTFVASTGDSYGPFIINDF